MAEQDTTLVEDFVSGSHPDYRKLPPPPPGLLQAASHHGSIPLENSPSPGGLHVVLSPADVAKLAESALARLDEVMTEAKRLSISLRTYGHQREVQIALQDLASVVHGPPLWDPRGMINDTYGSVWGNAASGAGTAGLGGDEMEAACSAMSVGASGVVRKSDYNTYQNVPNDNFGAQHYERGGEGALAGQISAAQNGSKNLAKAKGKKGLEGTGYAVHGETEDAIWKQSSTQEVGECANSNPAAKPNPEGITYAFVEFKRGRIRKYASVSNIPPGRYVMVDGDRGQDCGLLVQTIRKIPGEDDQIVCMEGSNVDENSKLEQGRVIRQATEDEVKRLHSVIASAEALALKTCRERCNELDIDIELVDVEYQFDMNKVSFFFDSEHSVDFRRLVRDLYRTFGARIWMENINPKVRNSMPETPHNSSANHNNGENNNWHGYKKKK